MKLTFDAVDSIVPKCGYLTQNTGLTKEILSVSEWGHHSPTAVCGLYLELIPLSLLVLWPSDSVWNFYLFSWFFIL